MGSTAAAEARDVGTGRLVVQYCELSCLAEAFTVAAHGCGVHDTAGAPSTLRHTRERQVLVRTSLRQPSSFHTSSQLPPASPLTNAEAPVWRQHPQRGNVRLDLAASLCAGGGGRGRVRGQGTSRRARHLVHVFVRDNWTRWEGTCKDCVQCEACGAKWGRRRGSTEAGRCRGVQG